MFTASLSDGTTSIPLYDAAAEQGHVAREGIPSTSALAQANSLWQPLHEASHAYVLVRRRDLDTLDLNGTFSLTFNSDVPVRTSITWQGLVVCKEPQAVTPGYIATDPKSVCVVELADKRWLTKNPYYTIGINSQFNVRAPAYQGAGDETEYYEDTLNVDAAWTWDEMVQDIWEEMEAQLGTYPGLPFSPDGTPEGWIFQGVSAWDALTQILTRLGCAVRGDLTAAPGDQFTIVQIGEDDGADATIADAAARKIHDGEFAPVIRGMLPFGVSVFFHRQEAFGGIEQTTTRTSEQWATDNVYVVDVDGPETSAEEGVYHPIWDDLPAITDVDGTVTNTAELLTRAEERADDYYRMRGVSGGLRLWQRYSGLLELATGSTLKGIRWAANSDGVWTEIVRHPFQQYVTDGQWQPAGSTKVQSPDLRPTWPVYPVTDQVLKLAGAGDVTPTGAYYDATLEKPDPAATSWVDKEAIWALELANAGTLTGGERFPCRLYGYDSGRPVYSFRSSTAGGSSHTVLNATIHTDSLTGSPVLGDLITPNATPKWTKVAGYTGITFPTLNTLTSSGTEVTATFASPHLRVVGDLLNIAGAVETAYNGAYPITEVPSATTAKMIVNATPSASPATGTLLANFVRRRAFLASEPVAGVAQAPFWSTIVGGNSNASEAFSALQHRMLSLMHFDSMPALPTKGAMIVATGSATSPGVSTLTAVGDRATLTFSGAHNLTNNDLVKIDGAAPDEFNGQFPVAVTGANTVEYTMKSAPASSPATGTILTFFPSLWTKFLPGTNGQLLRVKDSSVFGQGWTDVTDDGTTFVMPKRVARPHTDLTPGSNQNDYDIGNFQFIRLNPSANINITGLANGTSGRWLTLLNIHATNTVTLKSEDISSTAANRLSLFHAVDHVLRAGQMVDLLYDDTTDRWRLVTARGQARWIRFTLPGALATTDASKGSCALDDYWDGGNPGSTVTVYNIPASTNYIFSGASGAKGLATYDEIDAKYWIVQLECP